MGICKRGGKVENYKAEVIQDFQNLRTQGVSRRGAVEATAHMHSIKEWDVRQILVQNLEMSEFEKLLLMATPLTIIISMFVLYIGISFTVDFFGSVFGDSTDPSEYVMSPEELDDWANDEGRRQYHIDRAKRACDGWGESYASFDQCMEENLPYGMSYEE